MTRRRTALTVALVLALTGAACGGPEPSRSYGGKAVAVNVSFGKPAPDDPRAPDVPFVLGPVTGGAGVVPVAETVPKKRLTLPPPPPVDDRDWNCDVENGLRVPKKEATRELSGDPQFGEQVWRYEGVLDGTPFKGLTIRLVEDVPRPTDGVTQAFRVVSLLGRVKTTTTFTTRDMVDRVPGAVSLESMVAEGEGIQGQPSFTAAKPITLLPLDATQGESFADASTDPRTATTFKVEGLVVGTSRVWVCNGNVEAWQVKISQDVVTPLQRIHSDITYWIATQYGGLIVKEAVAWTGTAGVSTPVQGQYTATLSMEPKA